MFALTSFLADRRGLVVYHETGHPLMILEYCSMNPFTMFWSRQWPSSSITQREWDQPRPCQVVTLQTAGSLSFWHLRSETASSHRFAKKIIRKLVSVFCSWSVDYVPSRVIILKSKENQNKGNHKSEEEIYLSVIPCFHLYFVSPMRCCIWKKEKPFPMNLYSSQHKPLTSKPSLLYTSESQEVEDKQSIPSSLQ